MTSSANPDILKEVRKLDYPQSKRIFSLHENHIHNNHLLMMASFASLPASLRSDRERQSQDPGLCNAPLVVQSVAPSQPPMRKVLVKTMS